MGRTSLLASLTRMPDYVVHPNLLRQATLIFGCAAFVAAAAWMIRTGSVGDAVIAWIAIAFFGGGGLLLLVRTVLRRPLLTLTADGLVDQSIIMRKVNLPWADIA